MKMKRILLTARVDTVAATGEKRDAVDVKLAEFLASLGLQVLIVPNHLPNFRRLLADLRPDGIVLSGGNDIDPKRYRRPGPAREVSAARDAVELAAVAYSRAEGVPLVGVCRGLQLVNVAFGGTLSHDLQKSGHNHVAVRHPVKLLDAFPIPAYRNRRVTVNSYHNHGVTPADLAPGLLPMAVSREGLVEALRHPHLPIFAVQWHPERKGSPAALDRALFKKALGGRR